MSESLPARSRVEPTLDRPPAHRPTRTHVTRNLTEGSIPRNLWYLAWPQMIEQALNIAYQLSDLLWAGRLGATSIAGLGVAQSYTQLAMTGRMGFDTAMRGTVPPPEPASGRYGSG